MRRGHRKTAFREVPGQEAREQLGAGGIECRQRLVEEPQRAEDERQAREPDAPALALRQHARGKRALARQRDLVERVGDGSALGHRPFERDERSEILLGGELVLERGQVAGERGRRAKGRHRAARPCWPCQRISPDSGADRPASMRRSVVFPVPLAPVTTSASPASTRNESPVKSFEKPRRAASFCASSMKGPVLGARSRDGGIRRARN